MSNVLRRSASAVLALPIAALILFSTSGTPPRIEAQSASVAMVDNVFQPASISVAAGTTVTWANRGAIIHTATSATGAFDSGIVNPGGSYSFRFTQAGTFSYTCIVHPDTMRGTITVQAAPQPTAQATVAPAPPVAQPPAQPAGQAPVVSPPPATAGQTAAPPAAVVNPAQQVPRPPSATTAPASTMPAVGTGQAVEAGNTGLLASVVLSLTALASAAFLRRPIRR
jgi:plastocyanin